VADTTDAQFEDLERRLKLVMETLLNDDNAQLRMRMQQLENERTPRRQAH
jgi:hypothetical protein